jgi:hypothetical protein
VLHNYNGILFFNKKNDILSFAAKWMELEDIMLCEINDRDRDKY